MFALTAAIVLLAGAGANAQQSGGLRGQIVEEDTNRSLLSRSGSQNEGQNSGDEPDQETGFQPPDFQPESIDGDVADTGGRAGGDDGIFDLDRNNPFAGDPPPRARRRLSADDNTRDQVQSTRQAIEAEQADLLSDDVESELDLTTGTVPARRIDDLDDDANRAARPTSERTLALEGFERDQEEDPYAALGIRTGTFILFPELEQGLTWSSNADNSAGGGEALLSETTLRLNAQSDWSRHSARIEAVGTFRQTLSGADVSEPSGGINGDLRLDLINGFAATAAVGYRVSPETAASAVVVPGTVSQPLAHQLTGSLGLVRDQGKYRLAATGRVERLIYGDADLAGGGVLSQRERNSTLAAFTLRTGYEISPAIVPFVEAEIGRRFYDQRFDSAGFRRSADRYAIRAGLELDIGEKLTGEIAAGWVSERPDDGRLTAIEGVSAVAALAWSPMRGTTVNLDATTTVEATVVPGISGSVLYEANLGIERQIKANLTGNVSAGLGLREFSGLQGQDTIFDIEAGLSWWLNRNFGVTGRVTYEVVDSDIAGRDADAAGIFLGIRLRR